MYQEDLIRDAWKSAGLYGENDAKLGQFLDLLDHPTQWWPELIQACRRDFPAYKAKVAQPILHSRDTLVHLTVIRAAAEIDELDLLEQDISCDFGVHGLMWVTTRADTVTATRDEMIAARWLRGGSIGHNADTIGVGNRPSRSRRTFARWCRDLMISELPGTTADRVNTFATSGVNFSRTDLRSASPGVRLARLLRGGA